MTSGAQLLLARAEALLDSPDGAAVGNSARLAAFLARQAVEELIDARCAAVTGVQSVVGTARAKLAVLKSLDTTPAGAALVDAWHQLTGFCHHHAYQLSPTVAEVRAQCAVVQRDCLGEASGDSPTDDLVDA
ncbi:hypothetical protein [Mycobacteroides abscessus]|uniref:hypothetical protein n=1 Tax=Mycobacteroides abscessus TaxID=36809 RepID=UPI00070C4E1C|nr:hypothetical protein [Mycobacteroides abscessus]ALM19131.1 hypothetical protein AOY11_25505 [Mycobacteroides abscessus]AMU49417.1 hypothetical protein A3O01_04090 [Mycobacteroides abscessus]ANO08089.1 hypothetical protein BAB76_04090 [Mycobacteroides abscessus]MDM3921153.1 hypothetical protein [Mycobacteroides abscessus]MDO2965006.1 hypothetical protein [Mycobacteroides abscessus subsp. abscessus]